MEVQQTVGIGAIVLSSITILGGIFMAVVKMVEKNGSVVKCNCCCGSCECDMRKSETRQREIEITDRV